MDKILTFADRQAFREWLGKYGTGSDGVYLDAKSDKTRQSRLEKIIDRLNRNLKPM